MTDNGEQFGESVCVEAIGSSNGFVELLQSNRCAFSRDNSLDSVCVTSSFTSVDDLRLFEALDQLFNPKMSLKQTKNNHFVRLNDFLIGQKFTQTKSRFGCFQLNQVKVKSPHLLSYPCPPLS